MRSSIILAIIAFTAAKVLGQYDAPSTYYSTIASQTGGPLKAQLASIMTSGHVETSYADARDFLPFTDANPANVTQMFEFYTHNTIQKSSASQVGFVGLYESREHVWPDSLQGPGDTSHSSRGSRGDIHMLKPLSQSVNSSRGNNPYGGATATGVARNISGYWFPGMSDKGDAARICFYAATRWGSTLSLVNGSPSTNMQMGDLAALLRFNYQDAPDLFERRRNDAIYRGDDVATTGDDSTFAGTRNRNAFIDHPEYVWSVFADQQNDTQLSIGSAASDGSSSSTLEFGRVLRNAPSPSAKSVTLTKSGMDGTYFEVRAEGTATSTIDGRFNSFAMDAAGSRTFSLGTNASTSTTGMKTGSVTIDNLDVTVQGGAGRGSNDGNDVVNVQLAVLEPSNPSFSAGADVNSLTVDFDVVPIGSAVQPRMIAVNNLPSAIGKTLTAKLDLDAIWPTGSSASFFTDVATFTNLSAGNAQSFNASLNTSAFGTFATEYLLTFSDEDLPGTISTATLTLHLRGGSATPGDANVDGAVNFDDLVILAQSYALPADSWRDGDFDHDGVVDFDDLVSLAQNYNAATSDLDGIADRDVFARDWALAQALAPEPTTIIGWFSLFFVGRRRRAFRRI